MLQQFGMAAYFNDLTVIHHHDPVGMTHRRQAVGNHNHGAPLADRLHVVLDDAF